MPGPRTLAAVTSLLGPAALIALAVAAFAAEVKKEPGANVVKMDATLRKQHPGIVFVGNSKVWTDLRAADVAKAIGYTGNAVALPVPGSGAPSWYAVLEKRVFGEGYTPELVIVYGTLSALLRAEVGSENERLNLDEQLTTPSELIDRKIFGGASAGLAGRVRRHAASFHQAGMNALRDAAVGITLAPPSADPTLQRGDVYATAALSSVFGEKAKFRASGKSRAMPVVEATVARSMRASDIPVSDGLIPDIVAIAKAHGARVVFVRAPVPPTNKIMDTVAVDVERTALTLINSLGAGWIDLSHLDLTTDAWADDMHMGERGRARTTAALAEALAAADVLAGGTPKARMPLQTSRVTREGEPPAIALEKPAAMKAMDCAVSYKIPALSFLSEDALAGIGVGRASPLEVLADGVVLRPHASRKELADGCISAFLHAANGLIVSPPSLDAALTARLTPNPTVEADKGDVVSWVFPNTTLDFHFETPWDRGDLTGHLRARLISGGSGTFSVGGEEVPLTTSGRVSVADSVGATAAGAWDVRVHAGPDTWMVIEQLRLGESDPYDLIGQPPADLLLLSAFQKWNSSALLPVLIDQATQDHVDLPGWEHLSDEATKARLGVFGSPFRRKENGETVLAAKRTCAAFTWMYEGDVVELLTRGDQPFRLHLGADRLDISGTSFRRDARPDAPLHIQIRLHPVSGEGKLLWEGETRLPASGPPVAVTLPLDPPLPPRARIDVTLTSPEAFLALTGATLYESESRVSLPTSP